ncbi:MAG: endonuclease domain-containing protein [Planctomycetaceae bacterium]|nr:endonuclease domain-containing protein [Planctomycetaceae bacterium]
MRQPVVPFAASGRRDVLVGILNHLRDFAIARDDHWYRIPRDAVEKWLANSWPPRWLAFYQTKVFERESHCVAYYAQVQEVRQVRRYQLFPDEPRNEKSHKHYFQLLLAPLQRLAAPIVSRRYRKIVFIPTTWEKFNRAEEINDLYDESPLEDRLWSAFKRLKISAERREFVAPDADFAALDFAIYCATGKIDVETDGDTWHANREKAAQDNRRDNALKMLGWEVLRFGTGQVVDQLMDYCIPIICTRINKLGGVDEGGILPRHIELPNEGGLRQRRLFDDS